MRCSATNRDEVASHRLPKVITASLEMKKHDGGRPYDTILPPTGIYPYLPTRVSLYALQTHKFVNTQGTIYQMLEPLEGMHPY